MSAEIQRNVPEITPDAFRQLGVWAKEFSDRLRRGVLELAGQPDSPMLVTVEVLERAVLLTCQQWAAELTSQLPGAIDDDASRSTAA